MTFWGHIWGHIPYDGTIFTYLSIGYAPNSVEPGPIKLITERTLIHDGKPLTFRRGPTLRPRCLTTSVGTLIPPDLHQSNQAPC